MVCQRTCRGKKNAPPVQARHWESSYVTFVYTSIVGIMNTRGDMWTIYIIYIHFTLSLQKPCFFAAQQSLAHHGWWCHSNWRGMGQAQQWAFGSPAFASLFCTAGRPAWKVFTENWSGIFCLPCTSRRKLDFKRKRCLEWKMSWWCMAIEGAVVVFSRLLLCRVSKHSTTSIDFQYPWFQLDRPVLDLSTGGSRLWCCQNMPKLYPWPGSCLGCDLFNGASFTRSKYGPT